MATLKSQIVSDAAAGGVFLPVDDTGAATDFNELITFMPRGICANVSTVNAIIEDYRFIGTNEAPGDGHVLNKPDERSDRKTLIINLPASVDVQFSQTPQHQDQFVVRGLIYTAKRLLGKDPGMQRVLCTRIDKQQVRGNRRTG